jgi:ribonuclease HII
VPSRAQQPVPDRDRKKDGEKANHENRGESRLALRLAADTDHQMDDLVGAARFGAPKSVAVSREDKFSLGICSAGRCQSLAILSCELDGDLARSEEIESRRRENPQNKDDHARRNLQRSIADPTPCSCPAGTLMAQAKGGRRMPDFRIERRCTGLVCGVDEAGRGPLAGPVVAAAVVLDQRRFPKTLRDRLDDSKVLGIEAREACYRALQRCAGRGAARIGVAAASVTEIDRINILRAALLAMTRAVAVLGVRPDTALVDGCIAPPLTCLVQTVVKGDALSFSIAAASVVAKVTRDRIMRDLAPRYPVYRWETNVGYATPEHGEAIRRFGVTRHHRRSFAPVRLALGGEDILPLFAQLDGGSEASPAL